jgi:hypothetical protein
LKLIDEATSNEMAERFARRVAETGVVHWLKSARGCAQSTSNDYVGDDDAPLPVLLFFSDAAYARAVQKAHYAEYEVAEMDLFDLLYRWLPGMAKDGVAAGVNWRADLCGPEREPSKLRSAIDEMLPAETRAAHKARVSASTAS